MVAITPVLHKRIAIHAGHHVVDPTPDWTGTVSEYLEANQDTLTFGDINDMMLDLEEDGSHRIGGGAQGCFTIRPA